MSSDDERPSGDAADAAALIRANEELRRESVFRSRVEEALRADIDRFRMMVGAVQDYAILMLDNAGYVASWNDGANRITGFALSESIGQPIAGFYLPEDAATGRPAAALKAAAAAGRHAEEIWWVRKDGAQFLANTVYTALFDSHRSLRGFSLVAQDITERKRTEGMLLMQARVIEKMTESVVVMEATGCIASVNPATERMFGYSPSELIGRHVSILYDPENTGALDGIARRLALVKDGTTWSGDLDRRKRDGTRFITRTQLSAFQIDGRLHYYSISEDVTERRQVAEALRASEERFTSAFAHAPIGMALVGLEGRWLKVNRALCDLVGHSEAALLKRTFQDITHPEDLESDLENVRRLVAGEMASYQMEKRYFHARGHIVRVLLNVSLVRNEAGQPLYFVAQIQDITERKRAEEELRWKTAFLEAQVNSSGDGVLVVDGQERKLLQNHLMQQLWKIPQSIADDPDDRGQLQWSSTQVKNPEAFLERTAYLKARPTEISKDEIELKDGTVLDRYSAPVLGNDGKYYGRIWSFRDITERKKLEAHLLQSQKLEIVGRLAGGVAHEFNSILTVILGQAEFLLSGLPEGSPMRNDVREIIRATERAAGLTRQLLAYGRQQYLSAELLDLNQIITSLEPTLRLLVGGLIEVRIVAQEALWPIKADAGQMEQVILNLAMNALQAMPAGGVLTLETSQVTLNETASVDNTEMKPGGYVTLTVSDTGVGMTDEVKARVFEPFFSTKDVGQGSGLGLATCYGIIKQSGGNISVESAPGKGAVFRIQLPKADSGY
jgi:PAS domain S-box-containing protein